MLTSFEWSCKLYASQTKILEGRTKDICAFSRRFSRMWVLYLGDKPLKSASKIQSRPLFGIPKSSFGRHKVVTKDSISRTVRLWRWLASLQDHTKLTRNALFQWFNWCYIFVASFRSCMFPSGAGANTSHVAMLSGSAAATDPKLPNPDLPIQLVTAFRLAWSWVHFRRNLIARCGNCCMFEFFFKKKQVKCPNPSMHFSKST
jgi:hypothetical protein